jgi:hypothetical protein
MCFIFVEILGFYMYIAKFCIYLCMYLLQVVSRPPPLGIESDLFQCVQLAKEVQFEHAVVTGSLADSPFSALPPLSGQKRRGLTGRILRGIARRPECLAVRVAPWMWEPSALKG